MNAEIFTVPAVDLGPIETRHDVRSDLGPFRTFSEFRVHYPERVIQALAELYSEYNEAFVPLVNANREWSTDYQYCLNAKGVLVNYVVQIDMTGLSENFLVMAAKMSKDHLREVLKRHIYEIENSLALYQLLEKIFSRNGEDSSFKKRFRKCLDNVRRRFDRPLALLAVTEPKYEAMLASEFGQEAGVPLSESETLALSGFDKFFGPLEFQKHVAANGGISKYLVYARTSDPIAKLKKPDMRIEHPLLDDVALRMAVKASALTLNIDSPCMEYDRRINDTKAYMPTMDMAFLVTDESDLFSSEFSRWLKVHRLIDFSPRTVLRAKPLKGTYGCYGHLRGMRTDREFRSDLRRNIRQRGAYVVQPEIVPSTVIDERSRTEYTYIDRNFFGMTNGTAVFLGGVRSFVPCDSVEAKKGRNHGNHSTVMAEIVAV